MLVFASIYGCVDSPATATWELLEVLRGSPAVSKLKIPFCVRYPCDAWCLVVRGALDHGLKLEGMT